MKHINIFTDGACSGNPGPGGFAAIVQYDDYEQEITGGETNTTNNRMELIAVIEALNSLKESFKITLYTDSQYIVNAINKGWLESWISKNWKKSDGKPVLNIDLWQELVELLKIHKVTFKWVKGHNGHPENERCDKLAVQQRDKFSKRGQ